MALNVLLVACLESLFFFNTIIVHSLEDLLIVNMVLGCFILRKLGLARAEWVNVMPMNFFCLLNKNALFVFKIFHTLFEACSMHNEVYFLTLYR